MTTATNSLNFGAGILGERLAHQSLEAGMFCKDILQGLLSAVMLIAGSTSMMAGDAIVNAIPAGFEGSALEGIFTGRTMGLMEIGVAVLLFVATRRGIARTLGVMALIAFVAVNGSGLTTNDLAASASTALHGLADTLDGLAVMGDVG